MASTKRLIQNVGFYFIGSFATKLLQFLLIPIYSIYISTGELGIFSVITATAALALPILFQSVWEGSFRFTIEEGENGRNVLATSTKYCISLTVIYSVAFILISYILNIKYGLYILLFGLGQVGASYWQFAARSLKENKIYSSSAVINTAISITLNIILIIGFNQGLKSLLIANSVGSIVMVIILENRLKLLRDINKYPFNKALLKNILKYSMPLAINTVSWWALSSCNNYVITGILGSSANGIFGMALRFGTILSTITSIITLAWQEEAFRTYGDKDQDDYFNNVLNFLIKTLLCCVLMLIPVTFLAYKYIVFGEYKSGVVLTTAIYLGAIFNALSCHLGSAFLARKESNIMFLTTLCGGIISVILSILLVYKIGLLGAVIASLTGYLVNFFIRIPLLKKRINLQINYKNLLGLSGGCLLLGYICNLDPDNTLLQIIIFIIASGFSFTINRDIIMKLLNKFRKKSL